MSKKSLSISEYRQLTSPKKPKAQKLAPADELAAQIKLAGLREPIREYRFNPSRRWRADFAWPDRRLLLEVEGAVFVNGRHTRGKGFTADIEKYNQAVLDGYKVLRVTPEHIKRGYALGLLAAELDVDLPTGLPKARHRASQSRGRASQRKA